MKIIIEKIIYPGKSLARNNGKIIFTDHGLADEEVEVNIMKEKKDYAEAITTKILTPSKYRIDPRCGHHDICSEYQYIEYSQQILIKQQQLNEIFSRTLKEQAPSSIELTPSPSPWNYRNKIHMHIKWDDNTAYYAYHQNKKHDQFIQIDKCHLGSEQINNLLKKVIQIINQNKILDIEEIIIRESKNKDQLLLCVLGYKKNNSLFELLKKFSLLAEDSPVSGIIYFDKKTRTEHIIFGKNCIEDTVDSKRFSYGVNSFFQINQPMLDQLIIDLKKYIPLNSQKKIIDLYCGVGLFAIIMSSEVKDVFAVESAASNIFFLKKNIKDNKISNVRINQCDCEKWILNLKHHEPDILLVDPPRKGLTDIIIDQLIKTPPEFIAYISCDPMTLARDLKKLLSAYTLTHIIGYDFFPQTGHIETLAILKRVTH